MPAYSESLPQLLDDDDSLLELLDDESLLELLVLDEDDESLLIDDADDSDSTSFLFFIRFTTFALMTSYADRFPLKGLS